MLLSDAEAIEWARLHRMFLFFVNQRLNVLADAPPTPDELGKRSPKDKLQIRDAWLGNRDLAETFVAENPFRLSEAELEIVRSWRHCVAGTFVIYRELKNYAVFIPAGESPVPYGVLAYGHRFSELLGPMPVMVRAVLLPFKQKIIYDGLLQGDRKPLAAEVLRNLTPCYNQAKAQYGIVTSLPMQAKPRAQPRPKAKPTTGADDALKTILDLIDAFCRRQLNDEYAVTCKRLAETLARKRPSPLLSGSLSAWASGIVRTIGWVNFLNDNTQTPYVRLSDVDAHFGVGQSTGSAKQAAILKMVKITRLDPEWTLPSRLDRNPMVWMLKVNGFLIDVRNAPREFQELAFKEGLIPYVPADRQPAHE